MIATQDYVNSLLYPQSAVVGMPAGGGFRDIVNGYQERQNNLGANLETLGKNRMQQIRDYYSQQDAATDQSAISRGLANSTVRNTLHQGVNRQRDQAIGEAENDVAAQRLNYGGQWSGETLGFMANAYGQQNQIDAQRAYQGASLAQNSALAYANMNNQNNSQLQAYGLQASLENQRSNAAASHAYFANQRYGF